MISDFASTEALEAALPQIRDTLGALEAGLVAEQEDQAERRNDEDEPTQLRGASSKSSSTQSVSKDGITSHGSSSSKTSAPATAASAEASASSSTSTSKSQLRKQERLARQKAREAAAAAAAAGNDRDDDDGNDDDAPKRPAMSDHVTAWMAKLSARDADDDVSTPSMNDTENASASSSASSSAIKVADFGSEDAVEQHRPTREQIDGRRVVKPASGSSTPISRSNPTSEAATSDTESAGSTVSTLSAQEQDGFAYGFLVEMFPSLLPELIRRTLVNHGIPADAENADLTKVIESLLSVELVREAEERGQWPAEAATSEKKADEGRKEDKRETSKKKKVVKKMVAPPISEEQPSSTPGIPRPMDRPLSLTVPRYNDVRSNLARDSPRGSRSSSPRPGSGIRQNADLAAPSSSGYASSGTESTASDSSVRKARANRRLPQPERKSSTEARRKKRSSLSPWDRLRSLAGWLAEIVPASAANEGYFLSKFHSQDGSSLYTALRDALGPIAIPAARVKEELAVLKEVLGAPNDALDQDYSLSLCSTQGNISNAFDLYALLKELQDLESTKSPSAPEIKSAVPREAALASFKTEFEGQLEDMNVGSTIKARNRKSRELHPQNWKTVRARSAKTHVSDHPLAAFIPAYAKGPLSHTPLPAALNRQDPDASPADDYDLDLCRQQAAELRQKRQRAVMEAGRQFRLKANSGATGRQVASFYAEEARRYESNARMWELRAARSLVKQQR